MAGLKKAGQASMPIGRANVPIKVVKNKGYENFKGTLNLEEYGISIAMEVNKVTSDMRDKYDKEIAYFVKCAVFKSSSKR